MLLTFFFSEDSPLNNPKLDVDAGIEPLATATETFIKREEDEEDGIAQAAFRQGGAEAAFRIKTATVVSAIHGASLFFEVSDAVAMDVFSLEELPEMYSFFVLSFFSHCWL